MKAGWWGGGLLTVFAVLLGVSAWKQRGPAPTLKISFESSSLIADGRSQTRIVVSDSSGRMLDGGRVQLQITEGVNRGEISRRGSEVWLRAGVLPGRIALQASAPGYATGHAETELAMADGDADADGFPDVLSLDAADQRAFRGWFTYLAEVPAFLPQERIPGEINDCAALLRFAYRETLREHTAERGRQLGLPGMPRSASVRAYRYPYTQLGANLFRVREGRFLPKDVSDGAFAQFADAQTLQRLNSVFISRDIERAEPGDLLFYRQLSQDLPFHAMIVLGASHFERGTDTWVIYHTGPIGKAAGEIRRVRLAELLHYPEPRWRPVPGNRNFLGVYRWKILGGME